MELSVVMPCLNESRTLGICVKKAQATIESLGIRGEVVVADNGSTDGSQDIAESLGARVVPIEAKDTATPCVEASLRLTADS